MEDATDQGHSDKTVGEVEYAFALICREANELLNEPAGVSHFLNFFDDTPRDKMRRLLLEEVGLALDALSWQEKKPTDIKRKHVCT